jgi:hypothetical protein
MEHGDFCPSSIAFKLPKEFLLPRTFPFNVQCLVKSTDSFTRSRQLAFCVRDLFHQFINACSPVTDFVTY